MPAKHPKIMNLVQRLSLRTLMAFCAIGVAQADTQLLRFADIHKDQVVFVYSGDIYLGSVNGGTAQRLTAHEGFETFPKLPE